MTARKLFSAFGLIVASGYVIEIALRLMSRDGATELTFIAMTSGLFMWFALFIPFAWKKLTQGMKGNS